MRARIGRTVLGLAIVLIAALGQTSGPPLRGGVTSTDFCSTPAACFTPARGASCPAVRFGWGNCPGSRQACDWCYGPSGVFAYSPRGSTYTLDSGCNRLGSGTTWSTRDPLIAQWMGNAGGNCAADGRGGYACSNVDANQFKAQAGCGGPGGSPPATPTPSPAPIPTPSPGGGAPSACSNCYTPARGPACPNVRFGWGDCPGSRQACDWCYGPNGVFAYSPRGSTYTLQSGCNRLGANTTWSTQDPQVAQWMGNAGGNCASDGRGGYNCSKVDPVKYKQAAGCGGSSPGCAAPGPATGGGSPSSPAPTSSSGDTASAIYGKFSAAAGSSGSGCGCGTSLPKGMMKLCTDGKYFKDENNRTVVLRGVNLAGTSKIPPFLPLPKRGGVAPMTVDSQQVPDTVNYNFSANSDFTELDSLPVWGMNVIRLLFVWEAYEPKPGQRSQSYLDMLSRIVDEAASRGIYSIIDFHQDGFARWLAFGCGEGFPRWTIPAYLLIGARPRNDSGCSLWMPMALGDVGVHNAFSQFYGNTESRRQQYLNLMTTLARTFGGKKGVIGYDVLNEPFSNSDESELTSLYADVVPLIRQQDPAGLLFLEPNLRTDTGQDTQVQPPNLPGIVYAPHFYDSSMMTIKKLVSLSTTNTAFTTMKARAATWNAPLFIGEFGALAGTNSGDLFRYISNLHAQANAGDDVVSMAQWSYTPGWTPAAKDGWNGEDLSIVDNTGNYRGPNLFVPRPYPQVIGGKPESLTVDMGKIYDTLELHWTHNPGGALTSTQTVIYMPKYSIPGPYLVTSTPDPSSGAKPTCTASGPHTFTCDCTSCAAGAHIGVTIRRSGGGRVVP